MRPILKPALRLLWRDATTVQLGVDPRHAVVLDDVTPDVAAVLRLLDGTRDRAGVVRAAARLGVDPADAEGMLGLLDRAGALDDAGTAPPGVTGPVATRLAPDLAALSLVTRGAGGSAAAFARRRRARLLVVGAGRVGALVASLLAAAGVRRIALRDEAAATPADAAPGGLAPDDDGRPRVIAALDAARRAAGPDVVEFDGAARAPDATDCAHADLAIVAPDGWPTPAPALREALAAARLPYLVAGVREATGVVGPLVLPGRTSCPRCHDLARAAADPAWPALAAQLAVPRRGTPAACDVALAAAVAAIATGQALAHVSGVPPSACLDATLELRLPEWSLGRRTWAPHPDCGCVEGGAARLTG